MGKEDGGVPTETLGARSGYGIFYRDICRGIRICRPVYRFCQNVRPAGQSRSFDACGFEVRPVRLRPGTGRTVRPICIWANRRELHYGKGASGPARTGRT
ncbi:hypothetical protein D3C81_1241580 [compost metagenome]